jgi:D-alanyl-lipoteichoic acid acyltransferase DltB (MBOAT superfamily)
MVFNSFVFLVFFIVVYPLYLLSRHRLKLQNRILMIASCVFYGWWDWRFLALMFVSISTDYFCSLGIQKTENPRRRKFFLCLGIGVNLGILGFFKYFNFFVSSLQRLGESFATAVTMPTWQIILPVGVSFYTFQAISYIIDVYRREIEPPKNYWDYALFVVYFPHLVAGPIMKAKNLLPQVIQPRRLTLEKFYEGCYLIFWGLFQKMFVADNLAVLVDPVFSSAPPYHGLSVLIGLYAFAFQIYCDFAGYSNIARGLGKTMGFDIVINFNLPYFSTNPSEFWKRWHISLSTWLKEYLYIPLGGNRGGEWLTYRNLAITMLLGGLWHGANWTFVIWGAYQGLLLIAHRLLKTTLGSFPKVTHPIAWKFWRVLKIIFFFHLLCLGWLFFRADSFTQAMEMLRALFFDFRFIPKTGMGSSLLALLLLTGVLMLVQIRQWITGDLMTLYRSNTAVKTGFYYLCVWLMIYGWISHGKQFIYFQF